MECLRHINNIYDYNQQVLNLDCINNIDAHNRQVTIPSLAPLGKVPILLVHSNLKIISQL
jgi:hypothetical protein